jgi:16S rRNA (guanine527-N7)-methyltransferase
VLPEAGARPPDFFAAEVAKQGPLFGLSLTQPAAKGLARYLAELDRWRRRTNLTGPLSPEELVSHALESAFGGDLVPPAARVLDIGSGAGFPGIPLAIARPDISMTLLEPRSKRAFFLRHVIRKVPVENGQVQEDRLADVKAETYDAATVRAVGGLPELIGRAKFLRPGGFLFAWTTRSVDLARSLAPFLELVKVVPIPGTAEKVIALLRKAHPQPEAGD